MAKGSEQLRNSESGSSIPLLTEKGRERLGIALVAFATFSSLFILIYNIPLEINPSIKGLSATAISYYGGMLAGELLKDHLKNK